MHIITFSTDLQPQLISFFEKCFAALGWGFDPNQRHADIADIEAYYMRGGCFWSMLDGEKIIGIVALRVIDGEQKIFELKRMFVLPEYQGMGYGSQLLGHATDYAKALGFDAIYLDTRSDLAAAQHLYEKHGFIKREQYNNNNHADVYYELILK